MINISHNMAKVKADFQAYAKARPQATAYALNETARNALSEASKAIKQEYNFKPSDIKSATRIKKANPEKLKAVIAAGGKRVSLAKFIAGNNKVLGAKQIVKNHRKFAAYQAISGVPVEVKKGAPKILRHAFLVTFTSGHVAIFVREGKDRFPIGSLGKGGFQKNEFYAPAPWQLVKGKEKVMAKYYDENLKRITDRNMAAMAKKII